MGVVSRDETPVQREEKRMPKRSAGLVMYRSSKDGSEVFLVHPGGPFWAKKDSGAWSIPKGELAEGEDPLEAARREFREETGFAAEGDFVELGRVKQPGGKEVAAWAFEGDCDPQELVSNSCTIEWPPRSGRRLEFPEVDRGQWFSIAEARNHILKGQLPFVEKLSELLQPGP
jgi:predicted NUDIX family NTP pyrophosphohydrolase